MRGFVTAFHRIIAGDGGAGFESDRWELMLYERATGQHRSVAPSFDRPVDAYTWLPDSSGILLVAEDRGRLPVFRVGVGGGTPAAVLSGGAHGDVQTSPDGRTLVFTRSAIDRPAEVYRSAADGSGVTAVTRLNDALIAAYGLRPAEEVQYAGAGDTPIHAWIVKPPDFDPSRRYPLLYLVHGGPQGAWADSWGYRWNPQVFASAGYVVMMPNPRGSTGFGQQFTDEISRDWNGKVFEDLMKGVDFAEALPYVDRARKGAAGASYGGYMMNWFLGHTTRFKALLSHAGVYNLTSMYGATEELWFPEWDLGGTPWTNRAGYEKASPHMYAERFTTPTLVTHGELDFRVPIGEGLQLYTTLQRLNVPSKLIVFPDEGHWINRPANSALWYRAFIEWMDRFVKG
jgi:dipeptidyl aminopeptidase/acylaminoacyl peptidase